MRETTAEDEIARLRMHLKDAADVFATTGRRLKFGSWPGSQRSQIADECRFRAKQFYDALDSAACRWTRRP